MLIERIGRRVRLLHNKGEFAVLLTPREARDLAQALQLAALASDMEHDFSISVAVDKLYFPGRSGSETAT